MPERRLIDIAAPPGGWGAPWPNVAEIADVVPQSRWTLVGGLMTQLHGIHHGVDTLRPTSDVDMVLHIETTRGVAAETAAALESIGYSLTPSLDDRRNVAHRFIRQRNGLERVHPAAVDVVDVLVADHSAPRVSQRLRGRRMVAIEGGTQALRRTMNARLAITPDTATVISVPDPFAAAILKAAAYRTDSRDPERHLQDAALLLATIEDPYAERPRFAGSDKARLQTLVRALPDDAQPWRLLTAEWRGRGQASLRILTA